MLGWILRTLGSVAGVVDETVRKWVGALISGVYGFVHSIFTLVGTAWDDVFGAAYALAHNVADFVRAVYERFYYLSYIVLRGIVNWANKLIGEVLKYAQEVYHYAITEFDRLRHDIATWLDDLRHWVVLDIWDPIWRTLSPAWTWITHEGTALWHYLTHPADLVDLLWNFLLVKIEKEAWTAGKLLGRFFLSLIVHNLRTFVLLLEDIVDSVF